MTFAQAGLSLHVRSSFMSKSRESFATPPGLVGTCNGGISNGGISGSWQVCYRGGEVVVVRGVIFTGFSRWMGGNCPPPSAPPPHRHPCLPGGVCRPPTTRLLGRPPRTLRSLPTGGRSLGGHGPMQNVTVVNGTSTRVVGGVVVMQPAPGSLGGTVQVLLLALQSNV
jgi:hypothetical protein